MRGKRGEVSCIDEIYDSSFSLSYWISSVKAGCIYHQLGVLYLIDVFGGRNGIEGICDLSLSLSLAASSSSKYYV